MHILFITSAHNSLSQRLDVELREQGHAVTVAVVDGAQAMLKAVQSTRCDLIVAPMLKSALPEAIWRRHTCLIVHPGIRGDRGPSSLDWAISTGERQWGVTLLQAEAEMDAGPIWATNEFALRTRPYAKSSLYRHEVTEAAVRGACDAVARFERGDHVPEPVDTTHPGVRGQLRPSMKQADRAIDWHRDTKAQIVRKIRAADSSPGVLDSAFGAAHYLFGAHEEDRITGGPGRILAQRQGAICVGAVDGALWVTHLKAACEGAIKLPAAQVLGAQLAGVREAHLPLGQQADYRTWREIRYVERDEVGYLHFDFYNGAMSTAQCQRLRDAYCRARGRPTKVIVLMGGHDFFSTGIHLNTIEAADDGADESWHNIVAMNDLVLEILNTRSHLTVSALRGNAGAGGAMLALAADQVVARSGVILNPHYKGMGGLYGSEYWTYTLPRRVGAQAARSLTDACQPVGTRCALRMGLIDASFGTRVADFDAELALRADALASDPQLWARLKDKHGRRLADECSKPLAAYRQEELAQMRVNFYGADSGYHEARARFVHKAGLPARARSTLARA